MRTILWLSVSVLVLGIGGAAVADDYITPMASIPDLSTYYQYLNGLFASPDARGQTASIGLNSDQTWEMWFRNDTEFTWTDFHIELKGAATIEIVRVDITTPGFNGPRQIGTAGAGQSVTIKGGTVAPGQQVKFKVHANKAEGSALGEPYYYSVRATIPEPSSILALATGLATLAGLAIRRRR